MVNWQMVLLQLRSQYKPLAAIAREISMHPNTLQKMARYGANNMLFDNGMALLKLYKKHVKEGFIDYDKK